MRKDNPIRLHILRIAVYLLVVRFYKLYHDLLVPVVSGKIHCILLKIADQCEFKTMCHQDSRLEKYGSGNISPQFR